MRYKRGARTKHKAVLKFIVESSEKKYKRQGGESLILFLLPTIFRYQRVLWLNPSRLLHTTQLLLTFPREMGEGTRRALARNSCIEIEAVELRQAKQNKEFSHCFPFPTIGSCSAKKEPSHFTKDKCCNSQCPPLSAPSFYFCPEAPQLGTPLRCPGCAPPSSWCTCSLLAGRQCEHHASLALGAVLHSVNLTA